MIGGMRFAPVVGLAAAVLAGCSSNNDGRLAVDIWYDDIAIGSQRIGCD
jgi:hypothetical protein